MPAKYGTTRDDQAGGKTMRPGINLVQLVASACLAIALLALSAVATWSAFATSKAANTSYRAGHLSDAFGSARFNIAAEESPGAQVPARTDRGDSAESSAGEDRP